MADKFRLMRVHVPAATSRFFTVPEYEVLPIRTLWDHFCLPGMKVEVEWTGATVDAGANPEEEYERINANYRTPEGKGICEIAFGGTAMFAQHARSLLVKQDGPINRLLAGESPDAVNPGGAAPAPAPKAEEGAPPTAHGLGEIEAMKIDKRARAALKEAGFSTAYDVTMASDEELIALPYIGERNITIVRAEAQRVVEAGE
jgi:hypothetical protein